MVDAVVIWSVLAGVVAAAALVAAWNNSVLLQGTGFAESLHRGFL